MIGGFFRRPLSLPRVHTLLGKPQLRVSSQSLLKTLGQSPGGGRVRSVSIHVALAEAVCACASYLYIRPPFAPREMQRNVSFITGLETADPLAGRLLGYTGFV